MNIRRRQFLSLSAGLAVLSATRQALAAEEPPFAEIGERLDRAFAAGELVNLHAVVVSHRGRRVLERYYAGVDYAWGKPLRRVEFAPDTLHDLRSVTKSIVGLVYG